MPELSNSPVSSFACRSETRSSTISLMFMCTVANMKFQSV